MIRFATWAAVSTEKQVDGISLDVQVKKCTIYGRKEKWQDTNLHYIADGYSRTGYVNLFDAEREIPALGDMMTDLRNNRFDVVVLSNYDRLGDLILMVATEFRKYKKQLYSLANPTQIQTDYNPSWDTSSYLQQAFAPVWNQQRLADLRRKWDIGMPARVEKGLPPGRLPFGYKRVSKDDPPEQIPAEVELIKEMAKMLLEGKPLKVIARYCNNSGIKTRRLRTWSPSAITPILENPFFIGAIHWRKVKVVNKKIIQLPMSDRVTGEGKHKPVFTLSEFQKIQAELSRRREINKRYLIKFPLSGLLYCGKCGGKLYRAAFPKPWHKVVLREKKSSCHTYHYDDVFKYITAEVQRARIERNTKREEPRKTIDYSDKIKDVEDRIERVQQSAELGVFTPQKAAKRIVELQLELDKINAKMQERLDIDTAQKEFDDMFDSLDHIADWIEVDEPEAVNQILHSVIERIVLLPHNVQVVWRDSER